MAASSGGSSLIVGKVEMGILPVLRDYRVIPACTKSTIETITDERI